MFREKVIGLLHDLGSDADSVAAYLEGQGCVAMPMELRSNGCPVAIYLKQSTGADWSSVGVTTACVAYRLDPGKEAQVMVPPPVRDFIRRFDCGYYSALEGKQ